jgi:hypothetical protein
MGLLFSRKKYYEKNQKSKVKEFRKQIKKKIPKTILAISNKENFCSIVEEPWRRKGAAYALDVLKTFSDSQEEIYAGFKGMTVDGFSYEHSLCICTISRNSGRVVSSALCVLHNMDCRNSVLEIVFFATKDRKRNVGNGRTLFQVICRIADQLSVSAILVEAIPQVVLWWTLKNSGRKYMAEEDDCKYKVQVDQIIRADGSKEKLIQACPNDHRSKLANAIPNRFKVIAKPGNLLKDFYALENGSIPKPFLGKPYRYNTSESKCNTYHIWFFRKR